MILRCAGVGASGSSTHSSGPARNGTFATVKLWSIDPSEEPSTSSKVMPFSAETALTITARRAGGRSYAPVSSRARSQYASVSKTARFSSCFGPSKFT